MKPRARKSVVERILAKSEAIPWTGCLIWMGTLDGKHQYGQIRVDGRAIGAHTAMYTAAKGPVPAGLVLDHSCRIQCCCNPDHLEAVTQGENLLRGEHPNFVTKREGFCRRGHAMTPDNVTAVRSDGTVACRACHSMMKRLRKSPDLPKGGA